jgi:hypothetical protein
MAQRGQSGQRRQRPGNPRRWLVGSLARTWTPPTNALPARTTLPPVTQSTASDARGSSLYSPLGFGPLPTPRGANSIAVRRWISRIYTGTLGAGTPTIALPALVNTSTVSALTLVPGAVSLALPSLVDADTVSAPVVVPGAVSLVLPSLVDGDTLGSITLTPRVTLPSLVDADTLGALTLIAGPVAAVLPALLNASVVFPPLLSFGSISLTLPSLVDGDTLGSFTLTISEPVEYPGCVTVTVSSPSVAVTVAAAQSLLGLATPEIQLIAGVPSVAVSVAVPSVSISPRCC